MCGSTAALSTADKDVGEFWLSWAKQESHHNRFVKTECMCDWKRMVFHSIVAFKCHSASTYAVAAASHFSQLWWPCTCQVWNRSAKQTQKVFRLVHRKRTVKFAVARTQLELLQEKVSQQLVLNVNGVKPLSCTTTHRSKPWLSYENAALNLLLPSLPFLPIICRIIHGNVWFSFQMAGHGLHVCRAPRLQEKEWGSVSKGGG